MNKYFINGIGIHGGDDRFIKEVLVNGEYKYLFNYDTVVDCGANIGTFSLWIYPYAKRIFAVEPNPNPMELLRKTIEENKLDKIIPIEKAMTGSDEERFLRDTDDEYKQYGSGLINDTTGIKVKGTAIDTFMVDNKISYIDLLKVDIEGCEVELFSSPGFKNVQNKIGTIIGEYHNGGMGDAIMGSLNGAGFKFEDITKGNSSGKFIARRL